ncbi:MAG: glycosyltransferase [Bacillales bacterium]|jgi:glycosyltransferase involved in cell wall biosynthesis|nr:glycosyltransferase [Bacillales bacterium]
MRFKYKLSVVVIVYNTERFLEECLDSLVNQTLSDIEIIVVNDESTDNSLDIIKQYRKLYSNIRIINQKNSGGAVAGNRGLMAAKGEYVTIIDSDDVVVKNAYEKMYKKAKDEEADIVIGRPMQYIDGEKKEISYAKERLVWAKDRIVTDIGSFPEIFYDGFYWNKIYRRDFLIPNECLMPDGMLYADRPMVHKAFLLANKIVIINDVVYLWRRYQNLGGQDSVTQLKFEVKNLLDRFESLEYQFGYFNNLASPSLTETFMKHNIERSLLISQGILEDEEFKEVYIEGMKKILQKIPNVYDNDLGITKNLMVYMILNDLTEEFLNYVAMSPNGPIIVENDKLYWELPYFRDEKVKIPDHLFEIKEFIDRSITITKLSINKTEFNIQLKIPKKYNAQSVSLGIATMKSIYCKKVNHMDDVFDFFETQVLLSTLPNISVSDLYINVLVDYRQIKFKVYKKMINNEVLMDEKQDLTTRQLTVLKNGTVQLVKSGHLIDYNLNSDSIRLRLSPSSIGIKYVYCKAGNRNIYFYYRGDDIYELPYEKFIELGNVYKLYVLEKNNKSLSLRNLGTTTFENTKVNTKFGRVSFYETKNGNLSIVSTTFFSRCWNFIKSNLNK